MRTHSSDFMTPEDDRPVLIDFGRGTLINNLLEQEQAEDGITEKVIDVPPSLKFHTIAEDIFAYGGLIWELTKRWMGKTNRTIVPIPLVEVIEKCIAPMEDDRLTMAAVVSMFESFETNFVGDSWTSESGISLKEAESLLRPLLASCVSERPKPSAPTFRTEQLSYPLIQRGYHAEEEGWGV